MNKRTGYAIFFTATLLTLGSGLSGFAQTNTALFDSASASQTSKPGQVQPNLMSGPRCVAAGTESYDYDVFGRIAEVTTSWDGLSRETITAYSYDAAGNRIATATDTFVYCVPSH